MTACGLKGQKTSEDIAKDIYGQDAKEDIPTASNGMPIPDQRTSISPLLSCRILRIRGLSRGILRLMHNRGEQQRLHGVQRRSKRMPSKLQIVITAHFFLLQLDDPRIRRGVRAKTLTCMVYCNRDWLIVTFRPITKTFGQQTADKSIIKFLRPLITVPLFHMQSALQEVSLSFLFTTLAP